MLLDTMKKSVSAQLPGKIVNVASSTHALAEIDFDNLNLEKGAYWNPLKSYANSKLMVRISIQIYLFTFFILIMKLF